MYIPESKQYDSIEKYIKQNIDPQFKIDDFIITEYSSTITPSIHYLDIYYYLGDYKTNFGYQLTIIQKYVKTIKCTGNRNMIENLNMDQMKIPNISNEKLWEKLYWNINIPTVSLKVIISFVIMMKIAQSLRLMLL